MWNHHRNIQILINLIFSKRNLPNNLRHKHEFETKRRRPAPYGLEKIKLSWTPIFGTSTRQNQANIYNEDYVFFLLSFFIFVFRIVTICVFCCFFSLYWLVFVLSCIFLACWCNSGKTYIKWFWQMNKQVAYIFWSHLLIFS